MTLPLILLALAATIGWNIVATRRVAKSVYYDAPQKRSQFLLIWLLPIVGATLAFSLAREEKGQAFGLDLTEQNEKGEDDIRLDSASGDPLGSGSSHD